MNLSIASAFSDLLLHLIRNFGQPVDLDTILKAARVHELLQKAVQGRGQ